MSTQMDAAKDSASALVLHINAETVLEPKAAHSPLTTDPQPSQNEQLQIQCPQSASNFTSSIGPVTSIVEQENVSTTQHHTNPEESHNGCTNTTQLKQNTVEGSTSELAEADFEHLASFSSPTVSAVSVGDGVSTVKLSSHEPFQLAEVELMEVDSAYVQKFLRCDIVQADETDTSETKVENTSLQTEDEDTCNRSANWPRSETLRLIQLYKEYQQFFCNNQYKKKTVWAMLAAKLAKGSKSRSKFTVNQVYNRWKNLTSMYRDCAEGKEIVGTRVGRWRPEYFHEMVPIFNGQNIASRCGKKHGGHGSSNTTSPISAAGSGLRTIAPETQRMAPPSLKIVGLAHPSSIAIEQNSSAARSMLSVSENTTKDVASNSVTGNSFEDVVRAVQQLHENQKKNDAWKLERLEQMHKEKMQMFGQFLDILKEYKK